MDPRGTVLPRRTGIQITASKCVVQVRDFFHDLCVVVIIVGCAMLAFAIYYFTRFPP
jgi:hypothetical protein